MNAINVSYTAASTSGVWPTSTDVVFTSYAVFCVGNDKVREAMFKAWAVASGVPFKELVGSYKGVTEASFIVPQSELANIMHHGWVRGEESILLLGPRYRDGVMCGNRKAELFFPASGDIVGLGHFAETTKAYAMKQDAWTFDPSNGTYWVAE